MAYIGTEVARGFATTSKQSFSGDASTVAFTLTKSASRATDLEIFVDNVQQEPTTAYGVSGTTLTFTAAPSSGTNNIYVVHRDGSAVGLLPPQDLGSRTYTFGGAVAVTGDYSSTTSGTSNLRLGVNAGNSIVSGGDFNVVLGDEAGTALTTGDKNTAIGFEALKTEDTHGNNVAVGYQALKTLNAGADGDNTAVGNIAGTSVTTGVRNVFIGANAGDALTQGDQNVAVGRQALGADTLGSNSVAIGNSTLRAQNFTTATDTHNTAVGDQAAITLTTGQQNTFVGSRSGDAFTDADANVAVGFETLTVDTLGSKSTAIGTFALKAQNFTTATDSFNTAVGHSAGVAVTTGVNNVFVGSLAGDGTDDGGNNVAVGHSALGANAGNKNTAVGSRAGLAVTGINNTIIGEEAGLLCTGDANCFIGSYAAASGGSGEAMTTGDKNTILGAYNGNLNSLDIRTSDNNIVLSDGEGKIGAYINSDGDITTRNNTAGDNQGIIIFGSLTYGRINFRKAGDSANRNAAVFYNSSGNAVGSITYSDSATAFNTSSDYRLKENVTYNWDATTRLKKLKPAQFNFIADDTNTLIDGFIAHEAQSVVPESVTGTKDEVDDNSVAVMQGIDQSKLVPLLVKTIQELEARIKTLEDA